MNEDNSHGVKNGPRGGGPGFSTKRRGKLHNRKKALEEKKLKKSEVQKGPIWGGREKSCRIDRGGVRNTKKKARDGSKEGQKGGGRKNLEEGNKKRKKKKTLTSNHAVMT